MSFVFWPIEECSQIFAWNLQTWISRKTTVSYLSIKSQYSLKISNFGGPAVLSHKMMSFSPQFGMWLTPNNNFTHIKHEPMKGILSPLFMCNWHKIEISSMCIEHEISPDFKFGLWGKRCDQCICKTSYWHESQLVVLT